MTGKAWHQESEVAGHNAPDLGKDGEIDKCWYLTPFLGGGILCGTVYMIISPFYLTQDSLH